MIFKEIISKYCKLIKKRYIIYEYNLNKIDLSTMSFLLPKDYNFKYASDVNKDILKDFADKNRKPRYFKDVIVKNLQNPNVIGVTIIYKKLELAMLGWLYLVADNNTEGIYKLPDFNNSFLPMDGWVVEKHRGHGFHKISLNKRFLEAQKAGKQYGYALVHINNLPSLKNNDKFGFRIGKSYLLNVGFKKFAINVYNIKHIHLYLKKHKKIG